jgi:urease accessory protein
VAAPASPEALEVLLKERVSETLGRLELVYLRAAYVQPLVRLDEHLHTRLLAREMRQASSQVGAQLLENACEFVVDERVLTFRSQARYHHLPIVVGVLASALAVSADDAARTYAFQSCRSLVSAAQRLLRIGQREAQRLLHRLKPVVERAVETSAALDIREAGAFAPRWDIASMRHERAAQRLFIS